MLGLKRARRAKPGDIGRVQVDENCWANMQYLGEHEYFGPAVLIYPKLTNDIGEVIRGDQLKSYVMFYLFPDFVKDGLVEIVGHQPPDREVPVITRQRQVITRTVVPCKTWIIVDAAGQRTFRDNLTDEELDIPERAIFCHADLIKRLLNGWQPIDDVIRTA